MSSMQQRKDEILAKRAKLAELKKQRELRQKEFSHTRNSVGDASDVRSSQVNTLRSSLIAIDCFASPKPFRQQS